MNMNRPPSSSNSSDVINAYRKRRQRKSVNVVYLIAGLLILGGVDPAHRLARGTKQTAQRTVRHRDADANHHFHTDQHIHANRDTDHHAYVYDHIIPNS